MKAKRSDSADKVSLELKYCERCGGLWLRPAGGEQIYCVACGREMGELPRARQKARTARVPEEAQWGANSGEAGGFEGGEMNRHESGGGE